MRALAHTSVDTRFDELQEALAAAKNTKVSALERELVTIDDALEQTRREHAAAREAATTLDDDAFIAAYDGLIAKLDAVDATNATLPVGPVEPVLLRLNIEIGALLNSIRTAGIVIAPRRVLARDVIMRKLPAHVRPRSPPAV